MEVVQYVYHANANLLIKNKNSKMNAALATRKDTQIVVSMNTSKMIFGTTG